MKFRKKKRISVLIYFFVSFTNFKGIQGFYTKFQAISRVEGAKINSRLFKVFKKPWEPWITTINLIIWGRDSLVGKSSVSHARDQGSNLGGGLTQGNPMHE